MVFQISFVIFYDVFYLVVDEVVVHKKQIDLGCGQDTDRDYEVGPEVNSIERLAVAVDINLI